MRGLALVSTRSITYVPWLSTELLLTPPHTATLEEVNDNMETPTTKRYIERGLLFSAPCLDPQVRQMVAPSPPPVASMTPTKRQAGISFKARGDWSRSRQELRSKMMMVKPVGAVV